MRILLGFAAAGLAVLAAGSVAHAQHHGGGHGGGGHGGGGHYSGGHYSGGHYSGGHGGHYSAGHLYGSHLHGGYYGGHLHGGYYGGHVHGHVHVLPSTGYYYGSSYPYSYGSSYYPSVVASPVVSSVTTVVPVAGTSTSLKPNPLPAYTGPGVTLRLPAEYRGSVYVTIDKREVELKPGTEVALKDKASYVAEFDRGGDFGAARQELTEGVYKLVVGDKGWQVAPDAPAGGGLRPNPLPLPGPPK